VTAEGAGFKKDTNIITIFEANGEKTSYDCMQKNEIAGIILEKVCVYLDKK